MTNGLSAKTAKGFTLVETIAGMVVLAIAFSVIFTLVLPVSEQSAGQVQQIRAAELGQSLMNEILARRFDENTTNELRCGDIGANGCTSSAQFGAVDSGESSRADFDDVDDYDGYNALEDASGNSLSAAYQGFEILVNVAYDGDYDFITNEAGSEELNAKLITVDIITPLNEKITFRAYRSNF